MSARDQVVARVLRRLRAHNGPVPRHMVEELLAHVEATLTPILGDEPRSCDWTAAANLRDACRERGDA